MACRMVLMITASCMPDCLHRVQGHNDTGSVHRKTDFRGFRLFLRTYLYHPNKNLFLPIPGMPPHLPTQIREALNALYKIETAGVSSYNAVVRVGSCV